MGFFKSIIHWLLFTMVVSWCTGFYLFIKASDKNQNIIDKKAEAIIVLTGGQGRIDYGFELFLEGKAKRLFISGVHEDTKLINLLSRYKLDDLDTHFDYYKQRIELGTTARTTLQNAIESKEWINTYNIHSFYLVTANYHMPRSILEFENTMPHKTIIPAPVLLPEFKYYAWIQNPKHIVLMLSEYNKYIYTLFRQLVESHYEETVITNTMDSIIGI